MRSTPRPKLARRVLALTLPFTLVACGDDPLQPQLSVTDASIMLTALTSGAGFSFLGDLVTMTGPVDVDLSGTEACGGDGDVLLTGSATGNVDDETHVGSIEVTATQVHRTCQKFAGFAGVWTFEGAPSLVFESEIDFDGDGGLVMSGTYVGTIEWAIGESDGTCSINLQVETTGEEDSHTTTMTGFMCGFGLVIEVPLDI